MSAENTSISKFSDEELLAFTPAMRQFIEIKRANPSLMLLYRMGDFYETFFDDALRIHELLGLTLTSRSLSSSGEKIPMAGIPFTTLDQYLARLVREGVNVGICEQIGTPGKGIMERKLTRIITPGTLTDENLLTDRTESTLLAIDPPDKNFCCALSWMTISSGVFKAEETTEMQLVNEVERIGASEILVPDHYRDMARALFPGRCVTPVPDWHFETGRAEKTLLKQFGAATLKPFGIAESAAMIRAAGVVCEYASETQGKELSHITSVTHEVASDFLGLDASSRRNLELTKTLKGEGERTLFATLDRCKTSMGSRRLKSWITSPLRLPKEAQRRQEAIGALLSRPSDLALLRDFLRGMQDIERIATRIALRTVKPKELAALRNILPVLKGMSAKLEALPEDFFQIYAKKIAVPDSLQALLSAAIAEDPSTFVRDGGVIAPGYSAELDEIRNISGQIQNFLSDYEAKEKERTGIPTLRVEFNSVHGFYIEVSRAQSDKVPMDYRRRQTLKNVERFITSELKAFEEKALSSEEKSKALEKVLFEKIVDESAAYCSALLEAACAVSSTDAVCALASHAAQFGWVRPEFTSEPGLEIRAGRHPVVETQIERYIPNDCLMDRQNRLQIITGPNMGGKSTYMRSVALIVLLAYAGSFVPAASAKIGPIDKILTRIGASDDLARGLSTFMVEMTETAEILRLATPQSLILMDEIGRGTSTFDGLSLAGAIATHLVTQAQSLTLFATHYFELTELEKTVPGVTNMHVTATQKNNEIVFLHEIKPGAANKSYGIAVAKLAGIPRPVIREASKILSLLEQRAAEHQDQQLDLFFVNSQSEPSDPAEDFDGDFDGCDMPASFESPELTGLRELKECLLFMDPDDMSPRQAWEKLMELKKMAAKIEPPVS